MLGLGMPEVVIILVVFAVFMFGSSRVNEFARTLGRFTGEFKKGKLEIERELEETDRSIAELKSTIREMKETSATKVAKK